MYNTTLGAIRGSESLQRVQQLHPDDAHSARHVDGRASHDVRVDVGEVKRCKERRRVSDDNKHRPVDDRSSVATEDGAVGLDGLRRLRRT
jgi:hypothetical protein